MTFKIDDSVLINGKVIRKSETGHETLNFTNKAGVIKKCSINKKYPETNTYYVKTDKGTYLINESKLIEAPE